MTYYRQGDILFRPTTTDKLTRSHGKGMKAKDFVIAVGEVSGHSHRLVGDAEIFGGTFATGVAVKEPTEVQHEEHGSITLEPGAYEVTQEQTWDEAGNVAYDVAD